MLKTKLEDYLLAPIAWLDKYFSACKIFSLLWKNDLALNFHAIITDTGMDFNNIAKQLKVITLCFQFWLIWHHSI